MQDIGLGAGLAAAGFWLFIAAVVVGGMWDNIRKREAQHETLRRIIESGQPLDDELTNKLLALGAGSKDVARDLKVSGLICMFVAPGLAVLGLLMGWTLAEELIGILLGVAGLVAFVAIGLLVAANMVKRQYSDQDGPVRR